MEIKEITYQNSNEKQAKKLVLPGYFPILSGTYSLEWKCPYCDNNVEISWPLKEPYANILKVPSTKYYEFSLLSYLADFSNRFNLIQSQNSAFVKDTKTNQSPSLILIECIYCNKIHLLSYTIGIGNERISEPNTFAIRGIWSSKHQPPADLKNNGTK